MVGKNDLGAVRNEKIAIHFHARGAQGRDFFEEGQRIDHYAVADDAGALGPQNAAGHELQNEFFFVDDDGVSGVVAAGVARHDRKSLSEYIDDLTLALVAPLGSDNDRSSTSALFAAQCQYKLHLEFFATVTPRPGSHTLIAPCCCIDWKSGKIGVLGVYPLAYRIRLWRSKPEFTGPWKLRDDAKVSSDLRRTPRLTDSQSISTEPCAISGLPVIR